MNIRESYDAAAEAYAAELSSELDHKPLDRHLLNRFAEEVSARGRVADLGCGPGHITRYLAGRGAKVFGLDLSPEMVRVAANRNPGLEFGIGDMRRLEIADASLAGLVAFYSIVHTPASELTVVLEEMRRVLEPGGLALLAFHAGDDVVHLDELFGAAVSLDFRFHDPDGVIAALESVDLPVIERSEREPYRGFEYPSRRCYLLASAV